MKTLPEKLRLGIIGCGDFLRIQEPGINAADAYGVTALFDPQVERAKSYLSKWPGARVGTSAEEVIDAPDVDVVALFVPPWIRRPLLERAVGAGKHVITTKPFAPTVADCEAMSAATKKAGVCAAVIYNRTESRLVVTLNELFESGRFGRLALFKQDWVHHYPRWNTWALDPEKNGGPFMDAMIHNLNAVRHLMGRPATKGTFFSDRHAHPDLPCADTEFMKLDFVGNGSAHLFITWAADLEHGPGGNFREHFDIWHAVTDQGWRITPADAGGQALSVSRLGETVTVPLVDRIENPFVEFRRRIAGEIDDFRLLATLEEASEDIRIIRDTGANPGHSVSVAR